MRERRYLVQKLFYKDDILIGTHRIVLSSKKEATQLVENSFTEDAYFSGSAPESSKVLIMNGAMKEYILCFPDRVFGISMRRCCMKEIEGREE